jgi:hypothetical protein
MIFSRCVSTGSLSARAESCQHDGQMRAAMHEAYVPSSG